MPAVRYVGNGPVDIPDLGIVELPQGETIEVSPELAAQLVLQDVWEAAAPAGAAVEEVAPVADEAVADEAAADEVPAAEEVKES